MQRRRPPKKLQNANSRSQRRGRGRVSGRHTTNRPVRDAFGRLILAPMVAGTTLFWSLKIHLARLVYRNEKYKRMHRRRRRWKEQNESPISFKFLRFFFISTNFLKVLLTFTVLYRMGLWALGYHNYPSFEYCYDSFVEQEKLKLFNNFVIDCLRDRNYKANFSNTTNIDLSRVYFTVRKSYKELSLSINDLNFATKLFNLKYGGHPYKNPLHLFFRLHGFFSSTYFSSFICSFIGHIMYIDLLTQYAPSFKTACEHVYSSGFFSYFEFTRGLLLSYLTFLIGFRLDFIFD